MNEHTPGFYAIELQRLSHLHAKSCAALKHSPQNPKIISEYDAIFTDYFDACERYNLAKDAEITAAEALAHRYTKMSRINRLIFDIKSHFK